MTKKVIDKFYMPVGILAVACAISFGHFMLISDFLHGFLIGFGLTCMIAGLIKSRNNQE